MTTPTTPEGAELTITEKDLRWWIEHLEAKPEDEKVAFMRIAPAVCRMALKSLEREWRPIDDLARDGSRWWIGNSFTGETQAAWFSEGRWWIQHDTCLAPEEHPDFYHALPTPPTSKREEVCGKCPTCNGNREILENQNGVTNAIRCPACSGKREEVKP